jgi:hypothetical protein
MQKTAPKVHKHRSYTIKELSMLLHRNEKTCSRWIEQGLKTVSDKKPFLILGGDLTEFLRNRKTMKKILVGRNQFLCFGCKAGRYAKRGSIVKTATRKTGLCRVCNGKMSKTIKPHQNDYMICPSPT